MNDNDMNEIIINEIIINESSIVDVSEIIMNGISIKEMRSLATRSSWSTTRGPRLSSAFGKPLTTS